uniref:Secreted protein n=1 Tax=Romanomermis culicivorax TaxID=13658 RepID=A0A915IHH1_ROMCU
MFEISSSLSFKKSVICMAVPVMWEGAAGIGRADMSVEGSSFAMLRSKIGVSNRLSLAGSTSTSMGPSSCSSANSSLNMIGRSANRLQTYIPGSLAKEGLRLGMRFIQLVRRDLGLPSVRYHIHS